MSNVNASTGSMIIEEIDRLKRELDKLRPLPSEVVGRIEQKLRLDLNYHSNAIEGNSLTLGETRSLILHGLTAHGKPIRDSLDIKGHDEAAKAIEDAVKRNGDLNEAFIRNLHKVLLKEPYEIDAITSEGQPTKRLISIGDYKTQPNNVRTSTGEIYFYTPPEQVKPAMSDLIDWYRKNEHEGEHPIVIAATFHYRFVRIHPFDDGNGRMARLLMNMILIKHGYTVAIIPIEERDQYIQTLEQADKSEDLAEFISYVAHCCEYALNLHLKAARGEDIEDVEDIDKEIAIFKRSLQRSTDDTIEARVYADQVLYPFYSHCEDRIEQFSEVFGIIQYNVDSPLSSTGGLYPKGTLNVTSSVRDDEDKISIFPLSKENDIWPEHARSVSTTLTSSLLAFQGRQDDGFLLVIESETDSNNCIWKFSGTHTRTGFSINERCTERDLEELKKTFNELLRSMMKMLIGEFL